MVEARERIPAVVMLLLALIGFVIIYLLMVPPQTAYNLITGNTTSPAPSNTTPVANGAFYYPFTSYIGGVSTNKYFDYQIGTFGVSYLQKNQTLVNKSLSLSASIFGSSSYTINFKGNSSDQYFLAVNASSVSGSPRLTISLNGNKFSSTLPSKGSVLYLALPAVSNGENSLSLVVSLNGFAFSQSVSFSKIQFIQSTSNLAADNTKVNVLTLSGLGNYYVSYSPIGVGSLNVTVDNQVVSSISSGNDTVDNVTIPESIISSALPTTSSIILPVTLNVGFVPSKGVHYEIANSELVYELPQIAYSNATIPFTIRANTTQYQAVFYVNNILYSGSITLKFYPSGDSYTIPGSSLKTGENVILLPYDFLYGDEVSGNYTGTVTVSSSGLVVPSYISISQLN